MNVNGYKKLLLNCGMRYEASILSNCYLTQHNFMLLWNKPSLIRSFGFRSGIISQLDNTVAEERAFKLWNEAKTNPQYFIDENLKEINNEIELFSSNKKIYQLPFLNSSLPIKSSEYFSEKAILYHFDKVDVAKHLLLSDMDKRSIVDILEIEKSKLQKRLNIYLKKYGLSKLNVFTYDVDI